MSSGFAEQPPSTKQGLSIIIPAYNEEKRIAATLKEAFFAASAALSDFEIIVIDDGSADGTFAAATAAALELEGNPPLRIGVLRQEQNQGVGAAYRRGLALAKFPWLTLIPGDNAFNHAGIERLFALTGKSGLVISYRDNMETRTPLRHFLSLIATRLVRLVSGKAIRDAHSMFIFPVGLTRSLGGVSSGYGYHLETLCRLLVRADNYLEIAVSLNPKPDASSGVMKPTTLLVLGATMVKMLTLRLFGKL